MIGYEAVVALARPAGVVYGEASRREIGEEIIAVGWIVEPIGGITLRQGIRAKEDSGGGVGGIYVAVHTAGIPNRTSDKWTYRFM